MRKLEAALAYADRNAVVYGGADGELLPGMEQVRVYGGVGCPGVAEFAPVEFGAVMGMSSGAAASLMGDALALRHRLPRIWAAVLAGNAVSWRACKVARACLSLSVEAAAIVDRRVVGIVNTVTPSKLATIVRAAVWEADPELAKAQAEAAARQQGVFIGPSDDHGTKRFWVRAAAGDVIRFDATIDDLARALRTLGDTDSLDVRRAKAVGWIADPAAAHQLLEVARYLARIRPHITPATPPPPTLPRCRCRRRRESCGSRPKPLKAGAEEVAAADDAEPPTTLKPPAAAGAAHGRAAAGGQFDASSTDQAAVNEHLRTGDRSDTAPRRITIGEASADGALPRDRTDARESAEPAARTGATDEAVADEAVGSGDRAGHWWISTTPLGIPGHRSSPPMAIPVRMVTGVRTTGTSCPSRRFPITSLGRMMGAGQTTRRCPVVPVPRAPSVERVTWMRSRGGCWPGHSRRGSRRSSSTPTAMGSARAVGVEQTGTRCTCMSPTRRWPPATVSCASKSSGRCYSASCASCSVTTRSWSSPSSICTTRSAFTATRSRTGSANASACATRWTCSPTAPPKPPPAWTKTTSSPYDRAGPPGQTSTDNLIPQGRLHHRAKTFGDWRCRRLPTGGIEWTSPHGFRFHVDHTGTHPLPPVDAAGGDGGGGGA